MLPVRQFTATALRQCSRHTAAAPSACVVRSMSTDSGQSWRNLDGPQSNRWTNFMDMAAPSRADTAKSKGDPPESVWQHWEKSQVSQLSRPHTPYSGRSVAVVKGDLQGALFKLKGILTMNAVRSSHVRDERHEKKGEKRNRLKSQRWRRRFAHEVRKKVQLVNEIRARGA